jgi:hypothetical protein
VPLFEFMRTPQDTPSLRRQAPSTFKDLHLLERRDLQAALRDGIEVIDGDLLVLAEEFGEFDLSRRRIDLLALDRRGSLVVIEIKRTEDGGHMELQALRYAAMVSTMGFEDVVTALARHRQDAGLLDAEGARTAVLQHLGLSSDDEAPEISSIVRIILVSADFDREITTTVLWLNEMFGMDIRCVRLTPYALSDGSGQSRVVLDIQQIIPIAEASEYQVKVARKQRVERAIGVSERDYSKYAVVRHGVAGPGLPKRAAMYDYVRALVAEGVPLADIQKAMPTSRWRVVDGLDWSAEDIVADQNLDPRRWWTSVPKLVEHPSGPVWTDGERSALLSNQWGNFFFPVLDALMTKYKDYDIRIEKAAD